MIALKTILTSSTRQTHAFSFKGLTNTLGLFHRHNSNFCTNQNNKKIFLTPDTHVKHVSRAVRLFSKISSENEPSEKKEPNKPKSKKIKLNPNWKEEYDSDSLIAAFEKMAKRDGFDESTAIYADHDTFEDDFEDDDYDDLGFGNDDTGEGGGESMADRIAAAKRDDDFGSSSKRSKQNDEKMKRKQLKEYGYRWGDRDFYGPDDETSRKEDMEELFSLVTDARTCPACGTDFQCKDEEKPGFLPPEKYDIQMKLSKIEEMQKLQEKADSAEWSPEDEIEWLLQTSTNNEDELEEVGDPHSSSGINIRAVAEQLDLDIDSLSKKKIICKRCHRLQNFGEVEKTLRPGYTEEPLLSQEAFRQLLLPLREKQSVIIALVDLFDFSGSVLPELDAIAGDNPVILAANKADLLPSKMGQTRAENWVRRELEYMGVQSIANIGGAVRSISCKTGFGVSSMLDKARQLADEMDCDIYVVGAANAGKSTLINHILEKNEERILASRRGRGLDLPKKRAGNKNSKKGQITTSPLPGTTLKFIKVDLGGKEVKRSLYDTPGLLVPGTLTQLLTPAELKMVVPKKQVEPITFRVSSGKCVLVGGLARVEVIGDSKPFLFTFFVSNDIKLHPTSVSKADEFISKHAGKILTPPLEPGTERMEEIGEFEQHDLEIDGNGWKEAAADITLRGLGWVAVTGAGRAKIRISVPKDVGISVRPPLMPFDVWEATAKYTGGRAIRKSGKSKSGKRRKGVGRR